MTILIAAQEILHASLAYGYTTVAMESQREAI